MRPEKALALGDDPEKVPDVAQVLVRFPNGERKGRRFESIPRYRHLYGRDKESMSLKDAGLHPQASLFIEIH
ncbi:hypothetical protein F2Q69_00027660 [Brassica cretica]|uniref:UBX domain-containing protein n=1 Tax=Brassica cretica TaxID=69181 RepID=A0A8S9S1E1_BRACR|nr:hypothetical protein F2Q69_00027660 [Brassica cretica]